MQEIDEVASNLDFSENVDTQEVSDVQACGNASGDSNLVPSSSENKGSCKYKYRSHSKPKPKIKGKVEHSAMEMDLMKALKPKKQDEEELFGLSVAETLRRFSEQSKALAKMKITQALYDVEFPPQIPHVSNITNDNQQCTNVVNAPSMMAALNEGQEAIPYNAHNTFSYYSN